ncbi:Tetratricopeptide repeat-containing protein [Alteromonadaceae bacterium Bs31]|nr:Tetratricopeptide repeat-containing protein [Alteromonadaceae bacterium Bs31]
MKEEEYISEIKKRWPKHHESVEPTRETMDITLEALDKYPKSEKLWIIRGDLLQLVDYDDGLEINESEKCYRKAIAINPRSTEAYNELAHFLDVVMANPRKAKQYFEKVRLLKNA